MRTAVADTSREAFHSLSTTKYLQPREMEIMQLFGPTTRLSRQQISEIARRPINSICGRVDSLVTKHILIEEGERRDAATGKRQKLLRLPVGQAELF